MDNLPQIYTISIFATAKGGFIGQFELFLWISLWILWIECMFAFHRSQVHIHVAGNPIRPRNGEEEKEYI